MVIKMQQNNQEETHHHSYSIKRATMVAMAAFSIGYMISEPNLDGFNLEEALEYIYNEHIESLPIHIAGFVTSFFSNVPLLAAIIYCWSQRTTQHQHDHDDAHGHHHSFLHEAMEMLTIGGPFALMGSAAYLDTVGEIFPIKNLDTFRKVIVYSGAGVAGLLTGKGAQELHGFHVHDAMEENGGGITGFFKGIYTTFVKNVWTSKDNQSTLIKKVITLFDEVWKKYGIVGVHGFLGKFAADVFLQETGLAGEVPAFDLILKIFLPIAVMLFEGNTEARSLDAYKLKQQQEESVSYSLYSKLVVSFSGLLHTVPAITSLAILMSNSLNGPFDSSLYNSLIYLAAGTLLVYPSVYGFFATTLPGYDQAAVGLKNKICHWLGISGSAAVSDYENIDEDSEQEPTFFSTLLTKFGFHSTSKQPPIPFLNYDELEPSSNVNPG